MPSAKKSSRVRKSRRLPNWHKFFAVSAMLSLWLQPVAAQQSFFDSSPFPIISPGSQNNSQQLQRRPMQLPKKASRLEGILPRVDYPTIFLQPLQLSGVRIPGLTNKSVQVLGENFFLVLANTRFNTMAEIYRENRLRGKTNYVTADSIIHPYFAFTNRVIADVVLEHIATDLESMLKAMLDSALADYKNAEDADVRDDLEHNIAFLAVGAKLIDPKFFPPIPLHVVPLVQKELGLIYSGHGAQSVIFNRPEDYSSYEPLGWYNSSPKLQDFYRCRKWVSQMSYPFSDVAFSAKGTSGNYFRRSALLYRNLEQGSVNGKPAYATWERLYKAWPFLGAQLKDWQESTISPMEYKAQVKTTSGDLKVTLNALAEPLFRTKLLLSVRRQKPLKLGAISVFDLAENKKGSGENPVTFRLLPVTGDPEWPWLKGCTTLQESTPELNNTWPFPLLVLHAWGAPQANNTLLENYVRLDAPTLLKVLPDLDSLVATKLPGGILKPLEDRRWKILSGYFKPQPEIAQQVVRTEAWMTRMLESSFAGWVDSHLAIAPAASIAEKKSPGEPTLAPAAEAPLAHPGKKAVFHYLQASPEIFQKIVEDAQNLQDSLAAAGYLPDRHKERFADFVRLATRLQRMAELELKGQSLPIADVKLLQNIDLVLENVEVPTAGVLPLRSPNAKLPDKKLVAANSGVNFGLGRPGQLFIILQDGTNWTLGRGAVYTYFEVPGAAVTAEHWRRKLDNDLLRPVFWTEKFDTIQEATATSNRSAAR